MKHNLIRIDSYLFVMGDHYKSDKFPYLVIEKLNTGEYSIWQVDNPNDWDEKTQYQILVHVPLNGAPYLDGLDVLPLLNQNDEVDKLSEERFPVKDEVALDIIECLQIKQEVYAEGYNKAREKYKFTEEHVFGFLTYYNSINFNKPEYRYKHPTMDGSEREYNRSIDRKILAEYIQSLQQPKIPIAFECEMELVYYPANMPKEGEERPPYRPKTITNYEGRIEWVGKYIY
jgi:hypothetical protein